MDHNSPSQKLTGLEKASLLLIALGSETASGVLKHLSSAEVNLLCSQIAAQNHVDTKELEIVLKEFSSQRKIAHTVGGYEYAKELLEQALGADKAEEILGEISHGHIGKPFEWVKSPDIPRLANILQHERPQIIALVLAHLNVEQASALLSALPQDLQGNIAYRLTSMKPVDIDIVHTIDSVLRERIARSSSGDMKAVGGLQSLVTILNNADRSTENKIISYLEQTESDIADSVKQMLFVFEDIVNLDDKAIQSVIRELDQEDLRLSLKGASEEIREVFFRNMSERAVQALREDLEMMGSVRRRDVEAAQRRVVSVIRSLEEAGEISTRPDEEEDMLI